MDLRSIKRAIALESDRLKKRHKRSVSCLDLSAWCMKTAVCIAILLQDDFAVTYAGNTYTKLFAWQLHDPKYFHIIRSRVKINVSGRATVPFCSETVRKLFGNCSVTVRWPVRWPVGNRVRKRVCYCSAAGFGTAR